MKKIICSFCLICICPFLPAQAPLIGLQENDPTSFDGYTLLMPLLSTDIFLIDNCGYQVKRWETDFMPGNSAYISPDGKLIRTARYVDTIPIPTLIGGPGGGQFVQIYDWDNTLLWQFEYASDSIQAHHDIELLPNGNILILAWDLHSFDDAVSLGKDSAGIDEEVWSEHIIEVDPTTNQIVWEWWLWDHLVQDLDPTKPNYGVIKNTPGRLDINFNNDNPDRDWIHANSIDYNADLDLIMMNSRHTGEFYIIDHSTTTAEAASRFGGNANRGGDFLYRWGNKAAYNYGTKDDQVLFGSHDARWVKYGPFKDKIMVFNNGWFRPGSTSYSEILIVDPELNVENLSYEFSPLYGFGPTEVSWRYVDTTKSDFFSSYISGAHSVPNGNIVICEGDDGRIFEINSEKEIVWEYVSPIQFGNVMSVEDTLLPFVSGTANACFRATKYAPDYPGLSGYSLIPYWPIEQGYLEPYSCSGYKQTNNFGFVSIDVFPNPVSNELTVSFDQLKEYTIRLFDSNGSMVYDNTRKTDRESLDMSTFSQGMYFLQISDFEPVKIIVAR